jgi:NADPH:quinone reductase-like Zn-dependent oxidoreductase
MDDDELIACHETLPFGFGGLDVSAIILNKAKEPIMAIEHLNCNVSAREHVDTQQDAPRQLCYSIVTKPAISAMSSRHLMGRLQKSCAPLVEFLDLLAHAKPRLRIFDATLGTSLIAYIHGMKTDIHSRIQDYTLVSSSENMDSLQAGSGTGWNLTLVDSNFGPGSSIQDLPNQSFDVIFCSNSTFDGKASHQMKLLAALLVSGGKLLHLFPPETDSHHPRINDFAWPSLFPNRYFQTEELSVKGSHINESGYLGFVVADPREQAQNDAHQPTYTILAGDSDLQHAMAAHISTELTSHGNSGATIRSFHDLRSGLSVSKTHLILLLEVGQEFLRCLNEQDFQTLKHVLSTLESAHWISKPQAQWDARTTASLDMVKGFARVLRSEAPHRPFTIISLEQGSTISEDAVTVSKLLAQNDISGLDNETEYFMKDGIAHVQRVVSNPDLDKLIFESTVDQPRSAPVAEIGPVELRIERPGVFDSLNCIPVSQSLDLAPDEVEVDTHAFGLNFKDVVVALGKLPQSQMGYECAGVITRAGAKARLKPGTRVMVAHDQGMKTLNRYRCDLVVEIPAGLSFEEAAAIPTVGTTAYYSLVYRARLQQNETVLVHSATGATGQMCVQLALLLGAEVYATVGSAEKKTFLVQHYGLREDHIFYSRDTSFAPSVMAATEGRGVDVLVNSLAGDRLQASWEIMAPFGRFLELGRTEIVSNSYLPMARFANNVSFMAIGLDDLLPRRPPLVQEMLSAVTDLMETGKLCLPYPIRTYKLSEAERAFRHLMSGTTMGKLVLTVDPTDVVKTRTVKSTYKCLRSDATYVIAGGLGGLGRSAAKWMAGKGARHLLLLSRSGPQSESAKTLVRDLERAGVRVAAPTCDVSNEEQLASVLSSCQQTMPPFRGCIQGTMVLRVSRFRTSLDPLAYLLNFRMHCSKR